ncbi:hypothetical protein GE118_01125 [Mycoplasma sp. NEAQ87857]|nr:hypothetical protein GE118_01125 [Mycoplasma sp. NEAQ87857]
MIPEWFKDKYPEDTITMFRSYTLSKSLFMDLCPFFSIALCVSMILDKTKRWAFLVSPFCILGGLIVMPLIATIEKDQYFTPKWVFVGTNENRLYFLMHWFLIVFGSLAFVNFKNIVYKKDLLAIHIIALIFFAYVIFNAYVLNIDQNVTGVKIKDWYEGDYKGVRKLLNGKWHLPLWLTITLTYMTAYGFVVGLFSARYYFVKNKILAKEQPLKLQYS